MSRNTDARGIDAWLEVQFVKHGLSQLFFVHGASRCDLLAKLHSNPHSQLDVDQTRPLFRKHALGRPGRISAGDVAVIWRHFVPVRLAGYLAANE
jgi:hypothetical protein